MYDGREALPDDHKFRGQRGRVRARYRRPQLGRGSEKIGETSQRKTNLQLASGAFSCKVAPFTPAGERTKKAPSRGGRTGSNGQQHPVVIDCEVLQKRRSRCTTPGELRATRALLRQRLGPNEVRVADDPHVAVRALSDNAILAVVANAPCSQTLKLGPSKESAPPPLLALLNHRKIPNIDSNEGNNDEEQDDSWIAADD